MGRGSGSSPQTQTSVVSAIDLGIDYSRSSSEQVYSCECIEKGELMTKKVTNTITDAKRICIKVRLKYVITCLTIATLLVFGYGDGFSPSAIAHLLLRG